MNAPVVSLVAALALGCGDFASALTTPDAVFSGSTIRAQSPEQFEYPVPYGAGTAGAVSPGMESTQPYTILPDGGFMSPFQTPPMVDPFGTTVDPATGMYVPGDVFPGVNGPQPYTPGWSSRHSGAYLPKERTEDGLGHLAITEFDFEWRHVRPANGWIWSFTQEYWLRLFDGPESNPSLTTELPGNVHHFGWDFELSSAANGPYSITLGFNPSFNTDFEQSSTHDAWNWDARGMIFLPASPTLTWVIGAGYWDRVEDLTIPYAGFIWQRNERIEYRIVLPEPRISYFMGTPWGIATWFYVRGEYHVESYEIELQRTGQQEQVQLEDFRALIGFRSDGYVARFIEAGWVFDRRVRFEDDTPGFEISDGFIGRFGLSY